MNSTNDTTQKLITRCCVVGGGPAGMMLGFLLAHAGVEVVVLEKHADFFRDFRGDTIHPSTLELMYELGILDEFLQKPHQKARRLSCTNRRGDAQGGRFHSRAHAFQVPGVHASMGLPELHSYKGEKLS